MVSWLLDNYQSSCYVEDKKYTENIFCIIDLVETFSGGI